jgi:hypothetical protein
LEGEDPVRFKVAVYQEGQHGGYVSKLKGGTPTRVALSKDETVTFQLWASEMEFIETAQLTMRVISGTDFSIEFTANSTQMPIEVQPYYQQWGPNYLYTLFRNSTDNV